MIFHRDEPNTWPFSALSSSLMMSGAAAIVRPRSWAELVPSGQGCWALTKSRSCRKDFMAARAPARSRRLIVL